MPDNLKEKMLGAVAWSSIDRLGQQIVQLIIGLILARLLSPDDYGLMGMVLVFNALALVIVDGGFGQALIRKKNVSQTDYSTIFYLNIFLAALIYFLLFFLSPSIAGFFNQTEISLLGRLLFISVFFNALYLVPFAQLNKAMDFKTLARINISSIVLSAIAAIVLAVLNYGVWALVVQNLSYHFLRMLIAYMLTKWKPSFSFSFNTIKDSFAFSIALLATNVLNVIFNYFYVLIIAKFYPKSEVGYYTQANRMSETFSFSFQSIISSSTYALFSQIHENEERLIRVFRNIAEKISFITIPVLLSMIVAAKPFVYVLLTEKWLPSVPYFRILCAAVLFIPFFYLNITTLNARGKSKITFRIELIKKALIILSVLLTFQYGIIYMLWGYVFSCFLSYLISVVYLKKELRHFVKDQLIDLKNGLIIGTLIAGALLLLSFFISNLYLLFFLQLTLAIVLYLLIIRLFFKSEFMKAKSFLMEKMEKIKKTAEK